MIQAAGTRQKKMELLLGAVERAIGMDPAALDKFLNVLSGEGKYEPVVNQLRKQTFLRVLGLKTYTLVGEKVMALRRAEVPPVLTSSSSGSSDSTGDGGTRVPPFSSDNAPRGNDLRLAASKINHMQRHPRKVLVITFCNGIVTLLPDFNGWVPVIFWQPVTGGKNASN